MSISLGFPWMKIAAQILLTSEASFTRSAKACQILRYDSTLQTIQISDGQVFVTAFLTPQAIKFLNDELVGNLNLTNIQNVIIRLEDFHFTTLVQASGNRNFNLLCNDLHITCPLAIQISRFAYIGSTDSTRIGNPGDLNLHHDVRPLFIKLGYKNLVSRLKMNQFKNLYGSLPEYDGNFRTPPPISNIVPIRHEDCQINEQDAEKLNKIKTFNVLDGLILHPHCLGVDMTMGNSSKPVIVGPPMKANLHPQGEDEFTLPRNQLSFDIESTQIDAIDDADLTYSGSTSENDEIKQHLRAVSSTQTSTLKEIFETGDLSYMEANTEKFGCAEEMAELLRKSHGYGDCGIRSPGPPKYSLSAQTTPTQQNQLLPSQEVNYSLTKNDLLTCTKPSSQPPVKLSPPINRAITNQHAVISHANPYLASHSSQQEDTISMSQLLLICGDNSQSALNESIADYETDLIDKIVASIPHDPIFCSQLHDEIPKYDTITFSGGSEITIDADFEADGDHGSRRNNHSTLHRYRTTAITLQKTDACRNGSDFNNATIYASLNGANSEAQSQDKFLANEEGSILHEKRKWFYENIQQNLTSSCDSSQVRPGDATIGDVQSAHAFMTLTDSDIAMLQTQLPENDRVHSSSGINSEGIITQAGDIFCSSEQHSQDNFSQLPTSLSLHANINNHYSPPAVLMKLKSSSPPTCGSVINTQVRLHPSAQTCCKQLMNGDFNNSNFTANCENTNLRAYTVLKRSRRGDSIRVPPKQQKIDGAVLLTRCDQCCTVPLLNFDVNHPLIHHHGNGNKEYLQIEVDAHVAEVHTELQSYLNSKNVNALFVSIVENLLIEKPSNPIAFIIEFLSKTYPDQAKIALDSLTFTTTTFPTAKSHKDLTVGVKPNTDSKSECYSETKNEVIVEQRMIDAVDKVSVNEDIQIEKKIDDMQKLIDSDEEEEDDDDDDNDTYGDTLQAPVTPSSRSLAAKSRRSSVSSESTDPEKMKAQLSQVTNILKDADVTSNLLSIVGKSPLLKSLDSDQKESVVKAFSGPIFVQPGENIITQGENGDVFYLLESGEVDVYTKSHSVNGSIFGKKVHTYKSGDSFGELAILYNCPRAATCQASMECKVWTLDRISFKAIIVSANMEKRNKNMLFLKQVPRLFSLTDLEIMTLADTIVEERFHHNDKICTQGEAGDSFYIIKSGSAICTQYDSETGKEKIVASLTTGNYFGEISLLTTKPRQATVIADQDDLCVVSIDRATFTRVCGVLESKLQTRMEQYSKHAEAIGT